MFITTPENGFHFDADRIKQLEKKYNGKYIGYWAIRDSHNGGWTHDPVDILYVSDPSNSEAGLQYLGCSKKNDQVVTTDASTAFSKRIIGILCQDGEVLVSRYKDHRVQKGLDWISGGRDYIQSNSKNEVEVYNHNGQYDFMEVHNA